MTALQKKRDTDMTQGPILRHLIAFSLPLLAGYLFQQMYNMVDTWVIGNFASNEAFSAVGTVGSAINVLIGFFMGLSSGAGVVISQYYGAKKEKEVGRAVQTAMLMTLVLGVLFTFLGLVITPFLLDMMNTPDDILPDAYTYLSTYFSGIIGLMFYNIGSGILRAVGDSRRPFYFLVISAVINTVLDLVFVVNFQMGVFGVALATIIAQGVSALLVILTLLRSRECIRLVVKSWQFDGEILKKIFRVGLPAALQMAITSFSNVFVQSYINYFQGDCMSGWTAYSKIDQLIMMPMQAVSLAATTFVGQNLGDGQIDRAKKGVGISALVAVIATAVLIVPVMLFAPWLVTFFNAKPEVVAYGTLFLRWLSPFYILCCINQIYAGALRGAGNSRACMIIMLASFVVFRQIYLFIMANFIANEILPIAMSYPAGWLLASLLSQLYYRRVDLNKTRLVESKDPV
ncbi:MAG: MATE family efflux transporter [Clostridia bacterium]|nr:MATE family efflux transporter [Clostridia bacterium]